MDKTHLKFIHVADTHIGKMEFKLVEREQDFYNAFKQVIDFALEKDVNFVIHSGDLFDIAKPPIRSILFVMEQLKRLKEKGIPFFVIAGSHDMGAGETVLSILDKAGLLVNLSDKRYYDGLEVHGEFVNDTYVCGVYGKRAKIREIYQNLKVKPKGKFNIFMFHHTISDISSKFADIETSLLPKGFDYYAGGHWHEFFKEPYDRGIIVYPGSTEYCDVKEMLSNEPRGFVYYNDGKIERIEIKTRRVVKFKIKDEGDIEKIPNGNGEIAIIFSKTQLDKAKVLNEMKNKGYLYAKIYIEEEENETPIFINPTKSLDEIENEYLEENKYTKEEIEIAKYLMKLLGEKLSPKELDEREKEVIKFLEAKVIENK